MRATNRQGNRSGLLHSGERFSLCQERFPPAARNPPAYDIGQTTRNSSTAPHVEYADRHCRQKKFADNRFAANPGSSRSLSRFLYADYACSGKRPEQNTPAKRAKIPVPPDKNIRSDEKNSDSVPAVTPSVPDGSRMPPYTPVSCTEWLRSRNALDWEGSYSGILPCPDHGTATVRLTLSGSKYQLHILYGNGETKETEGEFVWDTTGGIITLHGEVFPSVYRVGENRLIPYGPNGNPLGLPDLEKEGH